MVGTNLEEKESIATHVTPSEDIPDHFSFEINDNGYDWFRGNDPSEARVAISALGLRYYWKGSHRRLGEITMDTSK